MEESKESQEMENIIYPHPWGALNDIASMVGQSAIEKGFRRAEPDAEMFGTRLLLIVSEVVEALEDVRNGMRYNQVMVDPVTKKMRGVPTELADVLIRTLDLCDEYGIDIGRVAAAKHNYNTTREYKHGKQF